MLEDVGEADRCLDLVTFGNLCGSLFFAAVLVKCTSARGLRMASEADCYGYGRYGCHLHRPIRRLRRLLCFVRIFLSQPEPASSVRLRPMRFSHTSLTTRLSQAQGCRPGMAPDIPARNRLQLARVRGSLGRLPPVKLENLLCGADS